MHRRRDGQADRRVVGEGATWVREHQAVLEIAVRKVGRNQTVAHEAFLGSLLFLVLRGMH